MRRRNELDLRDFPELAETMLANMTLYELRQALGRAIQPEDQIEDLGLAMPRQEGSQRTWPVRQVRVLRAPTQPPLLYWLTLTRDGRGELRVVSKGRCAPLPRFALGPDGEVEEQRSASQVPPPISSALALGTDRGTVDETHATP